MISKFLKYPNRKGLFWKIFDFDYEVRCYGGCDMSPPILADNYNKIVLWWRRMNSIKFGVARHHQRYVHAFSWKLLLNQLLDFRKVTHKTTKSDCLKLFENENKMLKKYLESVSKISLTTDIWKSTHQVVEYMFITNISLMQDGFFIKEF